MVKVIVGDNEPKDKVILGNTDKKIIVGDNEPKDKVVLGKTDKNVVIGDNSPKTKVITKKGPKGDIGPRGETGPQGATGPQGSDGADGAMSITDVAILEMEMAFKLANLTNFRETIYDTNGLLTNLSIYTNSSKTTKLFNKDFTYDVSEVLTTITLTRVSDSTILTKNLVYNVDGTLRSIEAV